MAEQQIPWLLIGGVVVVGAFLISRAGATPITCDFTNCTLPNTCVNNICTPPGYVEQKVTASDNNTTIGMFPSTHVRVELGDNFGSTQYRWFISPSSGLVLTDSGSYNPNPWCVPPNVGCMAMGWWTYKLQSFAPQHIHADLTTILGDPLEAVDTFDIDISIILV